MGFARLDWGTGQLANPIGDYTKDLGVFADRLYRQDANRKDAEFKERDFKLKEDAAKRAAAEVARKNKLFAKQEADNMALQNLAKNFYSQPGQYAKNVPYEEEAAVQQQVVNKRQNYLDNLQNKIDMGGVLTPEEGKNYDNYTDNGLFSQEELTRLQTAHENLTPYRKDAADKLMAQGVQAGLSPNQLAESIPLMVSGLRSRAEEQEAQKGLREEASKLALEASKEDTKKDIAYIKSRNKTGGGKGTYNLKNVSSTIEGLNVGGWPYDNDSESTLGLVTNVISNLDKDPNVNIDQLTNRDIDNALYLAKEGGLFTDDSVDSKTFSKYLTSQLKQTATNGFSGKNNFISNYNRNKKDILGNMTGVNTIDNENRSRISEALGYNTPSKVTPLDGFDKRIPARQDTAAPLLDTVTAPIKQVLSDYKNIPGYDKQKKTIEQSPEYRQTVKELAAAIESGDFDSNSTFDNLLLGAGIKFKEAKADPVGTAKDLALGAGHGLMGLVSSAGDLINVDTPWFDARRKELRDMSEDSGSIAFKSGDYLAPVGGLTKAAKPALKMVDKTIKIPEAGTIATKLGTKVKNIKNAKKVKAQRELREANRSHGTALKNKYRTTSINKRIATAREKLRNPKLTDKEIGKLQREIQQYMNDLKK